MLRNLIPLLLTSTLLLASKEVNLAYAVGDRPNVVLILADDLGWSDTTLYGTTQLYRTPNIQRLAQRGMTFTRAYSSSPLCSPTRASVMTGLSPARHGITSPSCHLPKVVLEAVASQSGSPKYPSTIPESVTRLKTEYYTLAEMFRDHGYATGHFGKWHLGAEPYSPLQHGFDVDLPHFAGPGPAGGYVAPWNYQGFDPDPHTPDQHIEDRMAQEAAAFIKGHSNQAFFLNYWMFSVHAPFDAKAALIEKYRGLVQPDQPQRCPTYAAMIESMDDAIGTLLDTLDQLGIADNTLIVFASDNGGNMYSQVDGTSATSNAPLRGGKATMYEGGTRGPAIVVHPGVVQPGSRSDQVIQSIDFYPTLLDILEIAPQPQQVLDGISIVPALKGGQLEREATFTYFPHAPNIPGWLPPAVSVHQGDWKLIRIFHGGAAQAHRYLLFNLRDDLGEQQNLADKNPERVQQLDALIEQHLIDTHAVRPLPNPNFDAASYDLTLEGQAPLKAAGNALGTRNMRDSKATGTPGSAAGRVAVAGWAPGGTCTLSPGDDGLRVTSSGGDPYLIGRLAQAFSGQQLTVQLRMKSNSAGKGQLFWRSAQQPFAAARSQTLDVKHNGQVIQYSINITPESPINFIRIDPSTGKGTIDIYEVKLLDQDGQVLKHWSF